MAKSIPALITPEVINWARNLDEISIEETALKLHVDSDTITAWENGLQLPTLTQAKELAKYYRVPFAYFYLPDAPHKAKRLDKVDFRTFNNWKPYDTTREFRWFLRDIEERRDAMLNMYSEADLVPHALSYKISKGTTECDFANQIRDFLSLTDEIQIEFRKPANALSYCISKLEEKDFLIFQAAKIDPKEMRGLSIAYELFPIISLNRKDEISARLFTLFHELAHILTRTSGICNDMNQDNESTNQSELVCNKIAGLALVPESSLRRNPNIMSIKSYGFDDTYVAAIARDFAVSREVILHRLWDIGIINKDFYFDTIKRYTDEYDAMLKKKKKSFLPPVLNVGSQLGKLYTRTVISTYHSERLTPRETSSYLLGLHIKHFDAIERWCY